MVRRCQVTLNQFKGELFGTQYFKDRVLYSGRMAARLWPPLGTPKGMNGVLQVWLLEMNANPALHTNCTALKNIIPTVVNETLGKQKLVIPFQWGLGGMFLCCLFAPTEDHYIRRVTKG